MCFQIFLGSWYYIFSGGICFLTYSVVWHAVHSLVEKKMVNLFKKKEKKRKWETIVWCMAWYANHILVYDFASLQNGDNSWPSGIYTNWSVVKTSEPSYMFPIRQASDLFLFSLDSPKGQRWVKAERGRALSEGDNYDGEITQPNNTSSICLFMLRARPSRRIQSVRIWFIDWVVYSMTC